MTHRDKIVTKLIVNVIMLNRLGKNISKLSLLDLNVNNFLLEKNVSIFWRKMLLIFFNQNVSKFSLDQNISKLSILDQNVNNFPLYQNVNNFLYNEKLLTFWSNNNNLLTFWFNGNVLTF